MPIIQGMDLSIHHWRVDQFMQAMVTQRTILGVRFINRSRKIFSPTEIHFCHKRSLPTKPKRSVRLRHLKKKKKKKCNTLSFWLSGLNFQRLHGMTRELEVHTHRPLTSFLSLSLSKMQLLHAPSSPYLSLLSSKSQPKAGKLYCFGQSFIYSL